MDCWQSTVGLWRLPTTSMECGRWRDGHGTESPRPQTSKLQEFAVVWNNVSHNLHLFPACICFPLHDKELLLLSRTLLQMHPRTSSQEIHWNIQMWERNLVPWTWHFYYCRRETGAVRIHLITCKSANILNKLLSNVLSTASPCLERITDDDINLHDTDCCI